MSVKKATQEPISASVLALDLLQSFSVVYKEVSIRNAAYLSPKYLRYLRH